MWMALIVMNGQHQKRGLLGNFNSISEITVFSLNNLLYLHSGKKKVEWTKRMPIQTGAK